MINLEENSVLSFTFFLTFGNKAEVSQAILASTSSHKKVDSENKKPNQQHKLKVVKRTFKSRTV